MLTMHLMGAQRIWRENARRQWTQRSQKWVMMRMWVYPTARSSRDTVDGECDSPSQPGSSDNCREVSETSPKKASGESTISDVTATGKLGLKRSLS